MKKIFLKIFFSTFIISAILGILIILLDLWNNITGKILLSTGIIFGFSVPGLSCTITYEKEKSRLFSLFGILICFISCAYFLLLIWNLLEFSFFNHLNWKFMLSAILLSSSSGHICLLLTINSNNKLVNYFKSGTVLLSIIMDLLLLLQIYFDIELNWKLLVAIAILIVLGTTVSPLMNKLNNKLNPEQDRYKKLEQLKHLLDSNAISEDEYETEKSKILNS